MKYRNWIVSFVLATSLLTCTGCPGEQGWQDGFNSGIEIAVSELISAPIIALVQSLFP